MPTTNPTAGQKAIIKINNVSYVTMTGIKTAELQIQQDVYDITDLNSNSWKLKLPGLADSSLKLGGNWDMSDAQQAVLQGDIVTTPGTLVQWEVWPKGTSATTNYAGSGYIKSMDVKTDVGAENQVTFEIDNTGAVVFTA